MVEKNTVKAQPLWQKMEHIALIGQPL